jgi:hypothetical protein
MYQAWDGNIVLLVLSVVTALVLLVTPFATAIWALHVIFGAS